MKKGSRFFSVLCALSSAVFLLSGAIALPILWRGFYYWQVRSLGLTYRSGFSFEVIREAYDQVMDYLVGSAPFGTGALKWSQEGMAHFADCRFLFRLDFTLLAVSAAALLILLVLRLTDTVRFYRFLDRGPCFWGLVCLAAVLTLLLVWALIDFSSLFTAFHTVCFPGKTNWVFDWRTDEIILILPEDFWARAGGLVAAAVLVGGALLTGLEELLHRFAPTASVYDELRAMHADRSLRGQ